MGIEFGRHWMLDLYLCQNKIWKIPETLKGEVERIFNSVKPVEIKWSLFAGERAHDASEPEWFRMSGELTHSFFLLQVFPEENFLMIDIFTWNTKLDFQHLSENLINLFAPQVVAAESKLRAEHLSEW